MVTAIIVAAGKSERMGSGMDKAFLSLGPKPVLAYSLMAFEACHAVDRIVLVVRKEQLDAARSVCRIYGISKLYAVVHGGARRQDSVRNGMDAMDPDTTIVAVHDAARPLVTPELVEETIKSAQRYGSGVAARKMIDTVKFVEKSATVDHTVDRSKLWTVQTPQTFKSALLKKAFDKLAADGATCTDESAAVEALGEAVRLVEWARPNFKITTPDDIPAAAALVRG